VFYEWKLKSGVDWSQLHVFGHYANPSHTDSDTLRTAFHLWASGCLGGTVFQNQCHNYRFVSLSKQPLTVFSPVDVALPEASCLCSISNALMFVQQYRLAKYFLIILLR